MIESYLRSLDTAIGDRLPAEVKAQRLREAEGHLRMAAIDSNGIEAVRRYGPARKVANALVRVHRGYDNQSIWKLAVPLYIGTVAGTVIETVLLGILPKVSSNPQVVASCLAWSFVLLFAVLFVYRASQTRRWLVAPWQTVHLACGLLNLLFISLSSRTVSVLVILIPFCFSTLLYLVINALSLGFANLADRRKVGNA